MMTLDVFKHQKNSAQLQFLNGKNGQKLNQDLVEEYLALFVAWTQNIVKLLLLLHHMNGLMI